MKSILKVSNWEILDNFPTYFITDFNWQAKPLTEEREPKRPILNKMLYWASALQNSPFNGKYADCITMSKSFPIANIRPIPDTLETFLLYSSQAY